MIGYGTTLMRKIVSGAFPTIPNMTLRLRADLGMNQNGGSLVQWTSQCGSNNGSIATVSPGQAPSGGGTAPTIIPNQINGHPVVRFNGTSDTLNFDNAGTAINSARWQLVDFTNLTDFGTGNVGSNTVLAIWKDTTTSTATTPDYTIPNVLGTFYANQWFFANTTGIGCQTFFSNPPVRAFINQAPGSLVYTESTTDANRSAPKGLLRVGTTGPTAQFDIFPTWGSNADLFIAHNSFGGTYLSMDLCELIIHSRALTAGELAAYKAYFNAFWGPGL